jgi:hypothetical protein
MRQNPLVFVLCLLLSFVSGTVSAQWFQANGPFGSTVQCLTASSTNLIVGTLNKGIFNLSGDSNGGWTVVNNCQPDTTVYALVRSGTNVFAGTNGGVFVSGDNGITWGAINAGLTNTKVRALAATGSNLYAGTYGGGVFLSTDNGANWSAINNGLTKTRVMALAISGLSLYVGTWGGGVYVSTDNGSGWIQANNGLPTGEFYVRALAASDTTLYVALEAHVYRSTDNGASWVWVSKGVTLSGCYSLAICDSAVIVGSYNGVFVSTNNGTTWAEKNSGLKYGYGGQLYTYEVGSLAVNGANLFAGADDAFGVVDGAVFLSTNTGASWKQVNVGMISHGDLYYDRTVTSLVLTQSSFVAATNLGVAISRNSGTSWSNKLNGLSIECVVAIGDVLCAGTTTSYGHGVYISTDDGASWSQSNAGLTNREVPALAVSGANLFAGTYAGVFLSTDNGSNWRNIGLAGSHLYSLAASNEDLVAGTYRGVAVSTDLGTSWSPYGLPSYTVLSVAISGTHIFAGTSTQGAFLSSDNGVTWSPINDNLTNLHVNALAAKGTTLFAGTDKGFFLSSNSGSSWAAMNSGLSFLDYGRTYVPAIYALAANDGDLFAGTGGGGVFRCPLAEMLTSVDYSSSELPRELLLDQNYPNPFNPSTTIRYGLPNRSHVTLSVYSTLGQQVVVLQNGEQEAGYHEVKFEARNLSSGVYFYRMQAGDFVQTRKLLLLR